MMGAIILGWLVLALVILAAGIAGFLLCRRLLPKGRLARTVLSTISVLLMAGGGLLAIYPTVFLIECVSFNATPPDGFVETDILVDGWEDSAGKFIAGGTEYQAIPLSVNTQLFSALAGEAAFTYLAPGPLNDRDNLNFYPIENDGGFDLYWPHRYASLYCPTEQLDAVLAYYEGEQNGHTYYCYNSEVYLRMNEQETLVLDEFFSSLPETYRLDFYADTLGELDSLDILRTSGDGIFVVTADPDVYSFLLTDTTVYYLAVQHPSVLVLKSSYSVVEVPEPLASMLREWCD